MSRLTPKSKIAGAGKIAKVGKAIVLTGERLDQNSVTEPTKVAQAKRLFPMPAPPSFTRCLPAQSRYYG